jgi:hypothetical protein
MNHSPSILRAILSKIASRASVAPLALVAAACSEGGNVTTPDLVVLPDLSTIDLKDRDYPPGPYAQSGNPHVHDTLPDFTFRGYWNPTGTTGLVNTTASFGEVTFDMLHDSGATYAIIQLAAFW